MRCLMPAISASSVPARKQEKRRAPANRMRGAPRCAQFLRRSVLDGELVELGPLAVDGVEQELVALHLDVDEVQHCLGEVGEAGAADRSGAATAAAGDHVVDAVL